MQLTMGEKIRILIKRKNITISELARLVGTTNQNLSNKLSRDNFSEKELQQIAEALRCKFEGYFVFEDGDKI
ncbi:XRE family transcriptional regulator [Clostridium tetani]|uniref:helix-turn-helix transcriptional regulator n=2 Tax=Clostridium tetani TaxID=1513 RepID=UPI0002ED92A7|nr:helix-turn-helix transcriptional regulator [Clostridium tetani]KGI37590.1 transcriptional regulator [Clostridium tetani]KGI39517.1 transcriptional regulator [Clostridium tetani ATCC 9441]KGI45689.1 transcriptional regulator [Clostridium tetani]KHO31574.1 transcriptional regulator [Clostridium tetani]KIG20635.1 transcriptional regulator [Clostridium tetani]